MLNEASQLGVTRMSLPDVTRTLLISSRKLSVSMMCSITSRAKHMSDVLDLNGRVCSRSPMIRCWIRVRACLILLVEMSIPMRIQFCVFIYLMRDDTITTTEIKDYTGI